MEAVELQDSAFPYHDWNERVTSECYAPMATSRILDEQGRIRDITNNYKRISFDFGPTLLLWMEQHAPEVYGAILEADRESRTRFSGHGAALATAYNHPILPLCSRRDKETQVIWGIRDFERRFQHPPEGMWLPETAVDLETLEILAEQGISFTVLAPRQALRVKPPKGAWQSVEGGKIDPSHFYRLELPSGRSIALFFYDGPISHAVAFEHLLDDGRRLADRLKEGFDAKRQGAQLVHVATDGETYGHHYPKGEMALAYALMALEADPSIRLTVYGEFLELHPPRWEVEIQEHSSWSCSHGIGRWSRDCGCTASGRAGWHQRWRAPLRAAFDWLRDALAPLYEETMAAFGFDPWKTRNEYIRVILDRTSIEVDAFLAAHSARQLSEEQKQTVLQLLELQRYTMLMYTSCGWFFADISGMETVQVIQYAARAVQLAERLWHIAFEKTLLSLLEKAPGNLLEYGNGRRVYEVLVKPAVVDLRTVGAHYAIRSLFDGHPTSGSVYCYRVDEVFFRKEQVGRTRLSLGRIRVSSSITRESTWLVYGALNWGDHNVSCFISPCVGDEILEERFQEDLLAVFHRGDFLQVLLRLEKALGPSVFSLRNVFRDEQRRILALILESSLLNAEALYRQIYEINAPLLLFLKDLWVPAPHALLIAAEYVIHAAIRRRLEEDSSEPEAVRQLFETATRHGISLDENL